MFSCLSNQKNISKGVLYLSVYKLGRLFGNMNSLDVVSFYHKYYSTFSLLITKATKTRGIEERKLYFLNHETRLIA